MSHIDQKTIPVRLRRALLSREIPVSQLSSNANVDGKPDRKQPDKSIDSVTEGDEKSSFRVRMEKEPNADGSMSSVGSSRPSLSRFLQPWDSGKR